MLVSEAPDIQIQSQKFVGSATQKWPFGLRQKERQILVSSNTQRSKVPKGLSKLEAEIDPRSIKIQGRTPKDSFLVLPSIPGSSQGPPGCQSGGRVSQKLSKWGPESKIERHVAYSAGIFSYSTGKCFYSTGIRARAPDPNPSETPAVTSKVIQSCPKVTKTHQCWQTKNKNTHCDAMRCDATGSPKANPADADTSNTLEAQTRWISRTKIPKIVVCKNPKSFRFGAVSTRIRRADYFSIF